MDRLLNLAGAYIFQLLRVPTHQIKDSPQGLNEFAMDALPDFFSFQAYFDKEWELWDAMQEKAVYVLEGPLGVQLACMRIRSEDIFFAVGPFLAELPDEEECARILQRANLPASLLGPVKLYFETLPAVDVSAVIVGAQLLVRHYYGLNSEVMVKTESQFRAEKSRILLPQRQEEQLQRVERRQGIENNLMRRVEEGAVASAVELYGKLAAEAQHLQRMSDRLRSGKNRLVVLNTMLNVAARRAAVNPLYIYTTFWDFAYRAEREKSVDALEVLGRQMVERYCRIVADHDRRGLSAPVRAAADYIHIHLSDRITLEKLAGEVKVSKNHLSALFNRELGQSLTAYINGQRVEKMAELLLTTQIPVGEVGSYVGYHDANYASRVFRAAKGLTPTAFRAAGGKAVQNRG